MAKNEQILIKPLVEGLKPITQDGIGEWYDLRSAYTVGLKAGDWRKLRLGIEIWLPDNCEAMIVPRPSTGEKWGIVMTNSPLIINNSNHKELEIEVYALRDTTIYKNDKICQMKVGFCQYDFGLKMLDYN